jgi:hypothetical protein
VYRSTEMRGRVAYLERAPLARGTGWSDFTVDRRSGESSVMTHLTSDSISSQSLTVGCDGAHTNHTTHSHARALTPCANEPTVQPSSPTSTMAAKALTVIANIIMTAGFLAVLAPEIWWAKVGHDTH